MKISILLKRYVKVLRVVLALVIGIGAFAVSRSESAKSMGVDIFFDIALDIYMLGFWAYLLKRNWHTWKPWGKVGLVLLMGVMVLTIASDIYDSWPRLPWVKAKAFTTVDEFMTDLKGWFIFRLSYVDTFHNATPLTLRRLLPAFRS